MQAETFILWLQGFLEACGNQPNADQCAIIQAKLAEVQMRGPYRTRSAGPQG